MNLVGSGTRALSRNNISHSSLSSCNINCSSFSQRFTPWFLKFTLAPFHNSHTYRSRKCGHSSPTHSKCLVFSWSSWVASAKDLPMKWPKGSRGCLCPMWSSQRCNLAWRYALISHSLTLRSSWWFCQSGESQQCLQLGDWGGGCILMAPPGRGSCTLLHLHEDGHFPCWSAMVSCWHKKGLV